MQMRFKVVLATVGKPFYAGGISGHGASFSVPMRRACRSKRHSSGVFNRSATFQPKGGSGALN